VFYHKNSFLPKNYMKSRQDNNSAFAFPTLVDDISTPTTEILPQARKEKQYYLNLFYL